MAESPAGAVELLQGKNYGTLVTLMPDGAPLRTLPEKVSGRATG